ncbi:N-6 DNA methylase [uncultured Microscilla sp.]|uniref:Eco57I restriction-modification methylase domain-containing protein n=1 Tax=uncultured Microscilla sp. TaxID=432653 RepID=UPI002620B2BB|nr:N-6 DNA methylase [uncultured Microscilla sp.]
MTNKSEKNKFGQYFTPEAVVDFMISLTDAPSDAQVLEPSCGAGIFLERLQKKGFYNLTAYEIDPSLAHGFEGVQYQSFVTANITQKFDLVIGNPPYIRWKNLEPALKEELAAHPLWQTYFNRLCDYLFIFILKSIEVLNDQGQLIFICPEYWLNTTHSLSLRNYMVQNGCFEQIYHFNETPIFDNASVSVIVFKYIKTQSRRKSTIQVTKYHKSKRLTSEILTTLHHHNSSPQGIEKFEVAQFKQNQRWLLAPPCELAVIQAFEQACTPTQTHPYPTIGEICHIGNGMVSGLDKAFQLPSSQGLTTNEAAHVLPVVKAKQLTQYRYETTTPYLFVNHIQSETVLRKDFPHFFAHLQPYKNQLEQRYQYNRHIPYWCWAFLRSYRLFSLPVARLFVPCKERISNKNHFRFSWVPAGVFPTQDVTALFIKDGVQESIYYVMAFLNSPQVFAWLRHKGIVKGSIVEFSEKPLSSIPFRAINWQKPTEVQLHQQIVTKCQAYIAQPQPALLANIESLFHRLFAMSQ